MSSALVVKFGSKYSVDQADVLQTLKQTCFQGQVNDAQMTALLVVADQYGLNPFTKEIYAFPDKRGGIVPVVGLDGWARIVNEHAMFDGVEFNYGKDEEYGAWMECVLFRKDRGHPIKIKEYMVEVARNTEPWKTHPRRMLRHKALIQCARIAFGFTGIYDEDEAQRIVEKDITPRPVREDAILIATQATMVDNTDERERLIADMEAVADNGTDALMDAWNNGLTKEQRKLHGSLSEATKARAKQADEFNKAPF